MKILNLKNLIATTSLMLGTAVLITGCTTAKTTTTARTATEQLLLSTAADHALKSGSGLEVFAGQKTFVDMSYYDSYDAKYVQGTIRDALSRAGALLEDVATNSDVIVEARSGAYGIDESDTMFGIPSLTLPIPLAGSAQTPEIAIYKAQNQRSTAKLALFAYARQSKAHVYSSGPMDGKSYDKHARLFFVGWEGTDLPEKQLTEDFTKKAQTWFPQYDARNWPAASGK